MNCGVFLPFFSVAYLFLLCSVSRQRFGFFVYLFSLCLITTTTATTGTAYYTVPEFAIAALELVQNIKVQQEQEQFDEQVMCGQLE